ncbi:MAG: DNA polymerase II [Halioglobus sp.]
MLPIQTISGFLLTRNWRDTDRGVELEYWFSSDEGPVCVLVQEQQSLFFIRATDAAEARNILRGQRGVTFKAVQLRDFSMDEVEAVYFRSHRQLRRAADSLRERGLDPLESDINPADRFLMERFITGAALLRGQLQPRGQHQVLRNPDIKHTDYQPRPSVVSVDIETAMEGLQLYSIGVHALRGGESTRLVFMLGEGATQDWVHSFSSQEAVLQAFLGWLAEFDPDILIGWNVVNFDLWYLQRLSDQLGLRLTLGRDQRLVHWRDLDDEGTRKVAQMPGRVVLDGIELLRAAFYRFESFSLENVSRQLLGEGKLLASGDRGHDITVLFQDDKTALADYNIKDCELVSDIFATTSLLDFAIARTRMTGLNLDRMGGSVASFDNLYLPQLHRRGFVAPNASTDLVASPGGFVLESMPGMYDHVLVLDFKSLYPSIIRTYCIDPLGLAMGIAGELEDVDRVPGYLGAQFARQGHILPELIRQLWEQRDMAKASDDQPLSQAIKIIMNSFYGVLGSGGCRFFDTRLASSITLRGHDILQRTRDYIENAGQTVIYGDTDSVFVWIRDASSDAEAQAAGQALERDLNAYWQRTTEQEDQLPCRLELEFETHYKRFLMPTIRGSDKGSKKRYAGVVAGKDGDTLVFKGLENVRTDWTLVAREFQEELYRRIFMHEPFEDLVLDTTARVLAGEADERLIYRKRLRRKLDEYQRNIPPHVQAARLCEARGLPVPSRGDWVEYVMTTSGAEPAAQPLAALDYQYYVDRQLEPVADGILGFVGTSFRMLVDKQIGLF